MIRSLGIFILPVPVSYTHLEEQKAKEVLKTIMLDVERKYVTVVPAEAEAKTGPTWADAH